MDQRYQRAKKLFLAVCDLPPGERAALLDTKCGGDAGLRAEVESLLAHREPPTASPSEATVKVSPEPVNGHPKRIGAYRVIREIGRGGMGIVYLGVREDDQFKRRVAIKVLKRGLDTEEVLRRFDFERQLLAALNHAGIARLYDGGETEEGVPYFVMEYVEGQPIDEYCDTHRLRIAERLELFRAVCSAVHYAHQNLVVHRDLKPSNIIVTKDGVPKLLDFGIAKLINPEFSLIIGDPTAPEFRVMTPEYASPEQVRGNPLTTASDVYSLGVMLYELMTGHRPYRLRDCVRAEIERVICEQDPDKPSTAISRIEEIETDDLRAPESTTTITPESVSRTREGRPDRLRRCLAGDIDNIVLMAMRKEPQRRYASAEQLAEDIHRHLQRRPVIARRDTLGYRLVTFVGRNRAGVAAAALLVLALLGGISGTTWQARVAAAQHEIADDQRDRAERMFHQVRQLAHTFMFDFHDAIQKLDGSIPARELLVTTALEYLDGLAEEVGENAALQRDLGSAYDRVGDIRGGIRNPSLGDTAGALENYRTAFEIREALSTSSPNERELQKELSTSHIKIGDMLTNTGDVAGALDEYREALRIRESLADDDPKYRRGLAIGLSVFGAALARSGKIDQARQYFERSVVLREELLAEEPDDLKRLRDVSVAYLRVGGTLEALGDSEGALGQYEQAIAGRQRIVDAEPDNDRAKRDLAFVHYSAGQALLSLDRPDEAVPHIEHFVAVAEQRVNDNPKDARAKRDLAIAYELVGMQKAKTNDLEAALDSYRKFQSAIVALSESDSANMQYRRLVATSYQRLGEALASQHDQHGAMRAYHDALEIVTALTHADPDDARQKADRAGLLLALGELQAETQATAEAEGSLELARTLYQDLLEVDPKHPGFREGLVSTLAALSKLLAGLDNSEGALEYAQEALATARQYSPSMLRDLAIAYHLAGDDQRAVEVTEEAIRLLAEKQEDPKTDELRQQLEADLQRYRR